MGVALGVIGIIIAIYGYGGAIGIQEATVLQQNIVEMRHLHGALGLIIAALGFVYSAIEELKTVGLPKGAGSTTVPKPEPIAAADERRDPISPRL